VRALLRVSSLFHLSPAAHVAATIWPSKYVWHQTQLRELIEDTTVDVGTIATLVGGFASCATSAAIRTRGRMSPRWMTMRSSIT
jgi:hypothetical protein